jgi:hypothetical protein
MDGCLGDCHSKDWRADPKRDMVSFCWFNFIINLSDVSPYSTSVIPIGINYVCSVEYRSEVIGCVSRETGPECVVPALQRFGENAHPKFRILAKQPSFLLGEGRTLREYRLAGFELDFFLVVQQQECHPS